MNDLLLPTTMILTITIMSTLLAILPSVQSQAVPLGVRIPSHYRDHVIVLKAIREYRLITFASWLIAISISIAFWHSPLVATCSSLIVVAGSTAGYFSSRQHIIAAKKAKGWFNQANFSIAGRISTEGLPAESTQQLAALPTPRFPWVSVTSALGITAAAAITVAAQWQKIPAMIATHWGPQLQPDVWAEKTIGSVFFTTFIALGITALMSAFIALNSGKHVHSRSDRSIKGQIKLQVQLAAMNTGMGILMLMLSTGLAFSQVVSVLPDYQNLVPLAFILLVLTSLGSTIALLAVLVSYQGKADQVLRNIHFEDDDKESPDNDEHFKFGMFYYNPDDPAVLVEKRYGVGVGLNYARWQGKAFMLTILLILCAAIGLPFLL